MLMDPFLGKRKFFLTQPVLADIIHISCASAPTEPWAIAGCSKLREQSQCLVRPMWSFLTRCHLQFDEASLYSFNPSLMRMLKRTNTKTLIPISNSHLPWVPFSLDTPLIEWICILKSKLITGFATFKWTKRQIHLGSICKSFDKEFSHFTVQPFLP